MYGQNQENEMDTMALVSSNSKHFHFRAFFSPVRLLDPILDQFLSFLFLIESLPPIFDMGDEFEELKSNIFSIQKLMDRKIPF
jgi:hypothetical protein